MARPVALLALFGAGLLLWYSQANALTVYADGTVEIPEADEPAPDVPDFSGDDAAPGDDVTLEYDVSDTASVLDAFAFMVMSCEHSAGDVATGRAFTTFYGGAQFSDLSDHPVLTGEMRGVPLPPTMCINAGIKSGNCVSTAAGAGQFTVPTWQEVRSYGGYTLPDFSHESQVEAIKRLATKCGATEALLRGDFAEAVRRGGKRWASLPGAVGKQGQRSIAFCADRFAFAQNSGWMA